MEQLSRYKSTAPPGRGNFPGFGAQPGNESKLIASKDFLILRNLSPHPAYPATSS